MGLITKVRNLSTKEKIIVSSIGAVILVAAVAVILLVANNRYLATTMRLLRVEGTVNIEDSSGNVKPVLDNIRFESGDALSTGSDGLASVGLDDTKIVTLENDSRVEFTKHDKQLELTLTQGALFFEVTEKLADDEKYEIKTSNMTVGIRGTSGYVYYSQSGQQSLIITDGVVKVTGYNPKTKETKVVEVHGGEQVTAYLYDESTDERDSIEFELKEVSEDELPEFPLQMLAENPELLNKVCEETGWDKDELLALVEALTNPDEPTPTPDEIIEITDTPTPTQKPKTLVTVTPTPTATASPSPKPSSTPGATVSPTPGPSQAPGATTTPTATPTVTSTPTPTVTPKPTTTVTPTPTVKPTVTPTPTDEPDPGPAIPASLSGYSKIVWGKTDDYGHIAYILGNNGEYEDDLYAYLGDDGWCQVYYREYWGAGNIGLIMGYFYDEELDVDVATTDDAYYVIAIVQETGPATEPEVPDGYIKDEDRWGVIYDNHEVYVAYKYVEESGVSDPENGSSWARVIKLYYGYVSGDWKELFIIQDMDGATGSIEEYYCYTDGNNTVIYCNLT